MPKVTRTVENVKLYDYTYGDRVVDFPNLMAHLLGSKAEYKRCPELTKLKKCKALQKVPNQSKWLCRHDQVAGLMDQWVPEKYRDKYKMTREYYTPAQLQLKYEDLEKREAEERHERSVIAKNIVRRRRPDTLNGLNYILRPAKVLDIPSEVSEAASVIKEWLEDYCRS